MSQRLDQQVIEQYPQFSRAFAVKLIEQGNVQVNGKLQQKAGYKLRDYDIVAVEYNVAAETAIPDITLPVIYEDKDCVVVNKPVGLLTHSKGAFNPEATVATWIKQHLGKQYDALLATIGDKVEPNDRAGIVHRLDRATSGVIICAKNPTALTWLQKQFSQRKTKKTYVAVVAGELKQAQAIIDMPIQRNPKRPQTFRVGSNGKAAVTSYHVLETTGKLSLVELKPTTGRTHQLRVHMAAIGHPIIGDVLYGGLPNERMLLHARELELTLPSRERKTFSAPLPKDFARAMEQL